MSGELKVERDNGATVMRELNTPFNNGEYTSAENPKDLSSTTL